MSRMASKRKRKKDDNFWSEFLQRSQSDNYLRLNESERQAHSWQPKSSVDEFSSLISDRSEYQSSVFKTIFGKQFETRAVDTLKKLTKAGDTYHFCQK